VTRTLLVGDFESFRRAARPLAAAGVLPAEIVWQDPADPQASLFGAPDRVADVPPLTAALPRVPRRFVELAELAALYRSPDRFALLYRVLYRLTHGEQGLLEDEVDPDVRALSLRVQSIRKDEHRMHAFVRFRKLQLAEAEHYVAWYAPEHLIVRLAAPFFQRRFAGMSWSILTPDESAHWDGETLHYGQGAPRTAAPEADELEALFRTYYSATYNPARANLPLFRKHVPAAFARHMPELEQLPVLMQTASEQAAARSPEPSTTKQLVPSGADIATLREAARACLACAAGELGTQTVFGEGPSDAKLCLVGEQPGDEEDRRGRVFVGPAGQVLDRALAEAAVPRDKLYITNAVKHFSYVWQGKRRLHAKPSWLIVRACKAWLEAELAAVQPEVVLCLGATAAQSFLGPRFSITRNRGRVFETPWAKAFIVTYHPSAILRMDDAAAARAYAELVEDLKLAQRMASQPTP
jgi:uracil-DNA glycosylase